MNRTFLVGSSLGLGSARAETILETAVDHLQVTHTAGTGRLAADSLGSPVVYS